MSETLTPKAQADELLRRLLRGKEVHEIFDRNMQAQLCISGQPMSHWEKIFKVHIPSDNMTPQLCIEFDLKIMHLNQTAMFFYAAAQLREQHLKRGIDSVYLSKFAALVEEYKERGGRLPSATTLETLAKTDNDTVESAVSIASIEAKYWKNILEHLATCRKLVENATLNISTELKHLSNEKMLDRMNSKINNGG